MRHNLALLVLALCIPLANADDKKEWAVYPGSEGPGKGKHIVLVSGDEEYRSEEALPQLAKILAKHHGFTCTVLFAIDPKTGTINPDVNNNIPGLKNLKSADLMIIATRFRNLPDEQMQHVVDYVESGKPIIGLRTATHAFNLDKKSKFAKYSFQSRDWPGGFGKQILGETWVSHHGDHGKQSTRGLIARDQEKHPIVRGIKDGDIWGPTDVYGLNLPLAKDAVPLVFGQVLEGMKVTDAPVKGKKNQPMMPVAWTRLLPREKGQQRIFTTTMGSSTDLASAGLRRLLVNAVYWTLGMEESVPAEGTVIDVVGTYEPSPFRGGGFKKGVRPADLQ